MTEKKLPKKPSASSVAAALMMANAHAMMMGRHQHGPYVFEVGRQRIEPDQRKCLQCGKLKSHNNSFCSAECCRAYKNK